MSVVAGTDLGASVMAIRSPEDATAEAGTGSVCARTAVVVATWNGAQWIERCLRSVSGADCPRLIVVDNGSSDETLEIVRGLGLDVEVVELGRNTGFGHATNVGIERALAAGAVYVLLLNQDIVCEPGMVEELGEALEGGRRRALASALQLTYEGTALDRQFLRYVPREYWDDLVLGEARRWYAATFMPAAAVLVRRAALLEVGGFEPLFFAYGEDDELCDRLLRAGWELGFVPQARVQHWHGLINHRVSFAREVNNWYSRALVDILRSPRGLAGALAGVVRRWFIPGMRHWPAQFAALFRIVCRLGRIRNRRGKTGYAFGEQLPGQRAD